MKYELKQNADGTVDYLMESGKDLVTGKMEIESIEVIKKSAEVSKSKLKSYPIQMGIFYFKGSVKK